MVANIIANNNLEFSNKKFYTKGNAYNKDLHISMKCFDSVIVRVLVDTSSSLNDMPKLTLAKLLVEGTYMNLSVMVVKEFDGSRMKVISKVDLPIQLGPYTFEITFQVMDINLEYSFLLGRPWIHVVALLPLPYTRS